MNILSLFGHVDASVIAGFIVSIIIPFLSALLVKTRASGFWVGALTLTLSAINGFLSTWAAAGSGFNWKSAIGAALVSWFIALLTQAGLLKDTDKYASLRASGVK